MAEYCKERGYAIVDSFHVTGDRETGLAAFMDYIQSAKENNIETIVMQSTDRIVGTVEELNEVRKAYKEAGVTLETMDGSHVFGKPADMIRRFVTTIRDENEDYVVNDPVDEDVELIFGYDVTSAGLQVNESEAEVVRFVFDKIEEYTENPPTKLIQEVIDEHTSRGAEIDELEAAQKVSYGRITQFIENEIKEKWPKQFESMVYKREHNRAIFQRRDIKLEPIIDTEEWEKVQTKLAEHHSAPGPQMGGMTM